MNHLFDTLKQIETPEGVVLTLRPAGLVVRMRAFVFDLLVRALLILIVWVPVSMLLGKYSGWLAMILIFLVNWFYPVVFEVWRQGATPGKKAMRLRVVHDDGTPVSLPSSLIRNLLRAVDMLPFFYITGMLSIFLTRHFRRLGDLAAGTIVEHLPPTLAAPQTDDALLPLIPAKRPDRDGVRALLTFAERRPELGEERARELALLLAEAGTAPDVAETKLRRVALWLRQGGE